MNTFSFMTGTCKDNSLFRIVDCYSWKTGGKSLSNWAISNPSDLATLSSTIENSIRGLTRVRFVFDSITGLVSSCSYNNTFFNKFLGILTAKIKAVGGTSIFIIAPEAHDQQFISNLRQVFDGVLEMKEDETGTEIKRLLRIFSLKGASHKTHWTPFEITSHGIMVKSELEQRCAMCSRVIQDEPLVEVVGGNKYFFDSSECVSTYRRLKALYGESFQ